MNFKGRNLRALAEIVIGDNDKFQYRSSSRITEFFQECDLDFVHNGSTRWAWTADRLAELLSEITKQAKNWLGQKLDATKRSQILFMDREDILDLYVVSTLALPKGATPQTSDASWDEIPF